MPRFVCNAQVVALVTESGSDWVHTIDRAQALVTAYEISPYEIAGFNETADTQLRQVSANIDRSQSRIEQSKRDATSAKVTLDVTIELEAHDDAAARIAATKALAFYDLSPFFLAGYNHNAGTAFTGFTIGDHQPSLELINEGLPAFLQD